VTISGVRRLSIIFVTATAVLTGGLLVATPPTPARSARTSTRTASNGKEVYYDAVSGVGDGDDVLDTTAAHHFWYAYDGGPGTDTISYASFTFGVAVTRPEPGGVITYGGPTAGGPHTTDELFLVEADGGTRSECELPAFFPL
jgi:hypothetical protein